MDGEDFEEISKSLKESLEQDEKLLFELHEKWDDLTPHNVALVQQAKH